MLEKSKYYSDIHHRHSIRLKGYDYSQTGLYFVTICTKNHEILFGEIVGAGFTPAHSLNLHYDNKNIPTTKVAATSEDIAPILSSGNPGMILNQLGEIANKCWLQIPNYFPNVELDFFQIMPNHIHAIFCIMPARAGVNPAPTEDRQSKKVDPTVGNIIGAYKSLVSKEILKIYKSRNMFLGKLWQRNYYEHIIRNEKSLEQIREYIINNPLNWEIDELYFKP